MAGFASLDVTYIQKITTLQGGSVMEYGCYSGTSGTSHTIPSTLKTLIGGLACSSAGNGTATNIADTGVDFSFTAATERMNYIVFGW